MLSRLSDKPPQAFRITRIGEFADAGVEQAFQEHTRPLHCAGLRRMLSFGALAYVVLSLHDITLLGGASSPLFRWLLLVRVSCAAACLALFWYLGRQPTSARRIGGVALASSLLALLGILLLQWLLPALLLPLAVLLGMVTISTFLLVPHGRLHPLVSLLANVAFLGIVSVTEATSESQFIVLATALLAVNAFGHLIGQEVQRSWRREFLTSVRLHAASDHDHLTGLFNRRYLYETVLPAEVEAARARRSWLAVVICDIDHFKDINDTHGHQAGDEALCQCAGILRAGTRHGIDTIVRFGGEEFLLLLPGTDLEGAVRSAERLRIALAETGFKGGSGVPIRITASFGVCAMDFDHGSATGQELICSADRFMYEAKHAGRNTVHSGKPTPAPDPSAAGAPHAD